jgi:hypothetical protein
MRYPGLTRRQVLILGRYPDIDDFQNLPKTIKSNILKIRHVDETKSSASDFLNLNYQGFLFESEQMTKSS